MVEKNPPCRGCGGPHPFDTTVPSAVWNETIRAAGLPDYLCLTCIVLEFARQGKSFTADLVGDGLSFVPISIEIDGMIARDVIVVSRENTALRQRLENTALRQRLRNT